MAYGVRRESSLPPVQDLVILADWGVELLTEILAIDSQSDERSESVPSTEGQWRLARHLRAFFDRLNLRTELDDRCNLLVHIPANPEGQDAPTIALIAHLDTAWGTRAVPRLATTPAWDGSEVLYPENDRLVVTADDYPRTEVFCRHDLLHGPGTAPIGLDDKLGIAELLVLTRVLLTNPEAAHGPIVLAFRPDEEIARMEAVAALAELLAASGVRYGFTVDGMEPFEVNVENFDASLASVTIRGRPLVLPSGARRTLGVRLFGVKSHGATAKEDGYRNATVLYAGAVGALGARDDIVPGDFASDVANEVDAEASFVVVAASDEELDGVERDLIDALAAQVRPHAPRGARVEIVSRNADAPVPDTDEASRLARHVGRFLASDGPRPRLSEESDGHDGYSNPFRVERAAPDALVLHYRLRAFTKAELAEREEHVRSICAGEDESVDVRHQYDNMGPALAEHSQLTTWPQRAAEAMDETAPVNPIRGGTGVDPLLARGIPVANLGTGYFAAESEKELTSRQMLARHAVWLTHLVQVIASA